MCSVFACSSKKATASDMRLDLVAPEAVDPPRKARYEFHPLNEEQIQQFLKVASGHRLEALFVCALATGMRRGELMALKWQDINFSVGKLNAVLHG
jgi:integrase